MLRLPWKAWGETDVMLGMAAELHDRMVCSCGCGQWSGDAHDQATRDRWVIDADTCYARRAITEHVKAIDPPPDAVLRVRLLPEGASTAADEYAGLLARFPSLRQVKDKQDQPDDYADEDRQDEKKRDGFPKRESTHEPTLSPKEVTHG